MDPHRNAIRAADDLAELLGDERGAATIRALRTFSDAYRRSSGGRRGIGRPGFPVRPGRIGVWDIVETDLGRGLRRRTGIAPGESSTWSAVEQVPGKGGRQRVVLVGESAARGYLLDPVFNPALALQRRLDAVPDGAGFQCVDLAHTSVDVAHLRHLVRSAAHLETDVLVMFAGNNWTISAYDLAGPEDPALLAGGLREEGYPGMRRVTLDRILLPQVDELLADLLRLRDRAGTRLVVVVPEFNLAGWSPIGPVDAVDVPMLPDDALSGWYGLRARAVSAARAGAWAEVRTVAAAMTELDGGLSPVPGYLLGSALAAEGDHAGARAAYEQARDSLCGLVVKYLPRTPRVVQDRLVEFCAANDVDCVDLRRLLGRSDAPELPDPEYFLDYCHLSDTGIERAMAAVAERLTGSPSPAAGGVPPVDGWTRAVSLVLAATYNSFCGQPREVVHGYLRRALDASGRVAELMAALDRLLARPGPVWASPDLAVLAREPNASVMFERLSDYRPHQSRLWTLREALAEVLGAGPLTVAAAGVAADAELLDISSTMLGVGAVRNYTAARCYLQANLRATEVRFALPAPTAGTLRVTHRRRGGAGDPVRLDVNGTELGRFVSGNGWSDSEFAVPAAITGAGVNVVRLTWPGPAVSLADRVRADVDALSRGEPPYVLPLFGELYSMKFCPDQAEEDSVGPAH
ncbi:hypothetical protein ACQEVC_37930 [Plantactinospora sp. CA-294935]|uniref:hypothetical protein n=1 Tax=Plantactinospora sp. CA-294935 TaxID=3240012 RepID=UPI003D8CE64A